MSAIPISKTAPHEVKPFVAAERVLPEFTFPPILVGSVLGVVFAASSVYLGLKIGLTVSASIPVAVLSITLFRWFSRWFKVRSASILENNIVPPAGSAGESLAAGVAFTLPSLLIMGFELEMVRVLLVALFGGLIGVLMMIPLRQGLIVKEHGKLTYPEGTACADVLIVGEQGGTNAKTVFLGFFVGLGYAFLNLIGKLWADAAVFAGKIVTFGGNLKGALLAVEVSPPMLGVGYIIGPRVAANMMAGGTLAFMILVPLIHLFGDGFTTPMYPETTKLISGMSAREIRNSYILYIGAGAVAAGGFIALARAIPTILAAFAGGLRSLKAGAAGATARPRTEQDLPIGVVIGGALAIAAAIWLAPVLQINPLSAVLIVLFGFFFVTVSSRITGEIGSSSNPISGMTVATLLITCAIFVALGWTGADFKALALTTAALVCVAASNGGTISQDLKTGFIVGATPRLQQIAIMIGAIVSALAIGLILQILDTAHTTYKPVAHEGFRLPLPPNAATVKGPDDRDYRLVYVREATGPLTTRGRYLVRNDGSVAFAVVASVDPDFPWRLERKSISGAKLPLLEKRNYPEVTIPIPVDAPTRPGLDGKEYRVIQLAEKSGTAPPGEYLATLEGKIAYATSPATELGLDHVSYRAVQTEREESGVPIGRYLVDESGTITHTAVQNWKFDAPKAQLFALIIDGTLDRRIPWGLVLVGMLFAVIMELVGVSSLPFAVGLYLPISTSAGIFTGGIVRWLVDRKRGDHGSTAAEFSPGVLMASGLIAGGAIAGVVQSIIAFYEKDAVFDQSSILGALAQNHTWWPMLLFLAMASLLYRVGGRRA